MENVQEVSLVVPEIDFTIELELLSPAIAYIRVISSIDDKIEILGNTETTYIENSKPTKFLKQFKIPYIVTFDHTQNVLFTVFCDDRLKTNNGFPLGNGEVRLIDIARRKKSVPIFIGTDQVGVINVYSILNTVEEKLDITSDDRMLSLGFKDSAPQLEAIKAKKSYVLEDAISYIINLSCNRFFSIDSSKMTDNKDYYYLIFFKILRKDSRLADKLIVEKTLPYKPAENFEQEWKVTHENLVGDEEYLSGRTELTIEMWVSEYLRGKVFDSFQVASVVIPMRKVLGKAGFHEDIKFKSVLPQAEGAEEGRLSSFLPPAVRRAGSNSSAVGSVASKGSSDEGGGSDAKGGGSTEAKESKPRSNSQSGSVSSVEKVNKKNRKIGDKFTIRPLIRDFGTLRINIDREITKRRYTAGSDVYQRHIEELLTTSKSAWITKVFPDFSRAAQQVSKESHHAERLLKLLYDGWQIAPLILVDMHLPCLQSIISDANARLALETNRTSCRVLDALLLFYTTLRPFFIEGGGVQCFAGGYTTIPDLRETENKSSFFDNMNLSPGKDSPGKDPFKLYNDKEEDREEQIKQQMIEKYHYIRRIGLPHIMETLLPPNLYTNPLAVIAQFCTHLFSGIGNQSEKEVLTPDDQEKIRHWQREVAVDQEISRFSYAKSHLYRTERELMQGFLEASVAYLPLINVKRPKKISDDISLTLDNQSNANGTTNNIVADVMEQSSTRRIASYTGSEYNADVTEAELLHIIPEFCKRGIRTLENYDLRALEALLMAPNSTPHVNVPVVWILGRSPPLQELRHFADILDKFYASQRTDKSLIIILAPENRYDFYSVSPEKMGELHLIAEPFKELITVFNYIKHKHHGSSDSVTLSPEAMSKHQVSHDSAQNVHLLWYRNWSEVMAAAYIDDHKKLMSQSQKLDARQLNKIKQRKLPTISSLKAKLKVAFQHKPHVIKTILGEDETNIDQLIKSENEKEYRNRDDMEDESSSIGSAAEAARNKALRISMSAAFSQVANVRKSVFEAANVAKNAAKMAGNLAGNLLTNVIGGNASGADNEDDEDNEFDIRDFKQLNAIKQRFDQEIRLQFQRNLKDMLAKTLAKAAGHENDPTFDKQLSRKVSMRMKKSKSQGQVEFKGVEA